MYEPLRTTAFFRFPERTVAWDYLTRFLYPWQALDALGDYLRALGASLPCELYENPLPDVYIAKSARVSPSVSIQGPAIICEGAELRQCAFLRGGVLVGREGVVGNSTELKNAILFDSVQVPHFNYVGDSILGYQSHLGAGALTSNVKSDKSEVNIFYKNCRIPTGRRKLGAILADHVEVGCHAVLNPGTIIARDTTVYPLASVRGVLPPSHIYKGEGILVAKR